NLKVQMSALRRVLNTDRDIIKTVHGRGYLFTVEASAASIQPDPEAWPASAPIPPPPLPLLPTGMSGRSSPRRQWASGSPTGEPDGEAGSVVVVIDDDPDIRDAAPRADASSRTVRRVLCLGPGIPGKRPCGSPQVPDP